LAEASNAALNALENEIARTTRENVDLKGKLAEVQTALADLRLSRLETTGKAIVDLPNPLRRVQ